MVSQGVHLVFQGVPKGTLGGPWDPLSAPWERPFDSWGHQGGRGRSPEDPRTVLGPTPEGAFFMRGLAVAQ